MTERASQPKSAEPKIPRRVRRLLLLGGLLVLVEFALIWVAIGGKSGPVVLRGHKGRVASMTFSPDGQTLASGSCDETITR